MPPVVRSTAADGAPKPASPVTQAVHDLETAPVALRRQADGARFWPFTESEHAEITPEEYSHILWPRYRPKAVDHIRLSNEEFHDLLFAGPGNRNPVTDRPADTLVSVPNLVHKSENTYRTDSRGRPVEVTGILLPRAPNMRGPNDGYLGAHLGFQEDDGFHIAANRFGFWGGPLNVVPGDNYLNLHQYNDFESRLSTMARTLAEKSANRPRAMEKVVVGKFNAYYFDDNATFRPNCFRTTYWLAHPDRPNVPIRYRTGERPLLGSKLFRNEKVLAIKPARGSRSPLAASESEPSFEGYSIATRSSSSIAA